MKTVGCLLLIGCDPVGASESGAGDFDSSGEAVPIAVDCSFSWEGEQIDVSYEADDERVEVPVGDKLITSGMLSDSEYEGRTFSIGAHAENGSVGSTVLYQMDRRSLPHNEFYGDHGFTGLNWVRDPASGNTLQYACFARDPSEPPHVWVN